MAYLFSSESVSEGHPDKVADQISDALLDQFLAYDQDARCAIETFNTTGQVVIMGEIRSKEYVDLQTVARNTINNIGYTKAEYQFDGNSCGVLSAIHEQSDDINRGVDNGDIDNQGAGDQGMMFGYACNETSNYMPVTLDLAHLIVRTLADIRKEGKLMTYLRPDSKSQVTVEYDDNNIPRRIDTIVVSTQHDEFISVESDSCEKKEAAEKAMLNKQLPDTCMTVQFSHIMAGGYAAGYYSYKWAEVLDADAFSVFKKNGIFDRNTAQSFRDNILSKGGTEHPMTLYKRFRGQEPTIKALLERNGIK